jgi:hypothetical protein
LLKGPENRNKLGGSVAEMFAFNSAISKLSLMELPLKGCKFTWTNKQEDPLLERLDWFFCSNAWMDSFPNSWATGLSRDISDHTPCLISATTRVPKPHIFRFRTSGFITLIFLLSCSMDGTCQPSSQTKLKILMPSSRTSGELSGPGNSICPV